MFDSQRIAVWGVGDVGKGVSNNLLDLGYDLRYIIDSNISKTDGEYRGVQIVSPERYESTLVDDIDVVIIGVLSQTAEDEILLHLERVKTSVNPRLHIITSRMARNTLCRQCWASFVFHNQWEIDFKKRIEEWAANLDSEVNYWNKTFTDENMMKSYLKKLNNTAFSGFDTRVEKFEEGLPAAAVVVDLGCGPASIYGTHAKNGEIQLISMDPLAAFYNKLSKAFFGERWDETLKIQFGLFEFVDSFLPEEYADVVLINNALDHCIDPYRSIVKSLKVLKVGGILRLCHRKAEAVYEGWIGLHKWNVDFNQEDELILWNKENSINVSRQLQGEADVYVTHTDTDEDVSDIFVTVEIRKKKPLNKAIYDYKKDAEELAYMLGVFMSR